MPTKKIRSQHVPISTHTVEHIHQVVRQAMDINEAAIKLRVENVTLSSHLSKFILDGELLNFSRLQQVTVERAHQVWGDDYEQAMCTPLIDIKGYTGAHIHEISLSTKTVRDAAIKLGVRDHTVTRHLRTFFYNGKRLNFRVLSLLSDTQAREAFGDRYDPDIPSQRIDLTPNIPMSTTVSLLDLAIIDDLFSIDVINDPEIIEEQDSFDLLASAFTETFPQENEGLFLRGLFAVPFTSTILEEPDCKRRRKNYDDYNLST